MDIEEIYESYKQFDPETLKFPNVSNLNDKVVSLEKNYPNVESDLQVKFPVMESNCMKSSLKSLKLLNKNSNCNNDEERNIFEAWFDFKSEKEIQILPGDSFGFLIGNFDEEVNELIDLLQVNNEKTWIVNFMESKTLNFPKDTVYRILKYYIEIRAVPSKAWIFKISQFCENEKEKKCLMFLTSKEGSKLYDKYILNQYMGMLDILKCFKSCKPGFSNFLINSIQFTPRYYSIIDFIIEKKEFYNYSIKIAFSVTHLPKILNRENTQLLGIFTGTLQQRFYLKNDLLVKNVEYKNNINANEGNDSNNNEEIDLAIKNLENGLENLYLNESFYLFKRKNMMFRMADKLYSNTILISVGTGITPFLCFFKYLEKNIIQNLNIWLVHGCRNKKDCLYLDELIKYEETKLISKFKLCCSRITEENDCKYVQDYIKQRTELKDLINNDDTVIYVCGDQKKMVKDVFDAFVEINHNDKKKLKEMQIQKRYLQDVWY